MMKNQVHQKFGLNVLNKYEFDCLCQYQNNIINWLKLISILK